MSTCNMAEEVEVPTCNTGESGLSSEARNVNSSNTKQKPMRKRKQNRRDVKRPYECSFCPFKFETPSKLKNHIMVHTGEKPFECSVCNKKFRCQDTLNTHFKLHHTQGVKECSVCGKEILNLKQHMLIHSRKAGPRRIYECTVCDKLFSSEDRVKRHMSSHPEDKVT